MYFSKTSSSRSICINGDWDNVIYEMTLQDGESLTKAEEAIEQKLNEWESKVRAKRTPPEKTSSKLTGLVNKSKNKEQEESANIAEMLLCKDVEKLKEFEIISKTTPALTATYNTMFKKLSK